MKIEIQKDIDKILFIIERMNTSEFIYANTENHDILTFDEFSQLNHETNDKTWFWFKLNKKKKMIHTTKSKSVDQEIVDSKQFNILKHYIKFILKIINLNVIE